jgi:hypothetical protein
MNKLRIVHETVHEYQIKHIIRTTQEQIHRNELIKNKGVLKHLWSVPETLKFLSHLNPMNKLRTVHGTVLEHQNKNIIGITQGQIFRTNHYQELVS